MKKLIYSFCICLAFTNCANNNDAKIQEEIKKTETAIDAKGQIDSLLNEAKKHINVDSVLGSVKVDSVLNANKAEIQMVMDSLSKNKELMEQAAKLLNQLR